MVRVKAVSIMLAAVLFDPALAAGALRGAGRGEVSTAEAERSLVEELAGNASSQHLAELEAALRPMYAALPKGPSGLLGHQAVRYALHRLLLQRHGWFIVGLEPTDEALPPYLGGGWVPEYLQGLLEQRLGGRGVDLHEIAALAAALEGLVRAETVRRVDMVYELLKEPTSARLGDQAADRLLETYMMIYLDDSDFSQEEDIDIIRQVFKKEYADWGAASSWMQQIKGRHLQNSPDGSLGHADIVSIANELGEHFGAFNDGECRSLKQELLALEGSRPGRVPLLDFYKKGLYSHWQFNEKSDYLRALGTLDETSGQQPSLVLPNYLGSRPNCLAASSLYSVCCRNECEDLMSHLERAIAAPSASVQQVLKLVAELRSDTVTAPRELPEALSQRLQDIAARHGGQVPLHARLFAQWMHHAYPRECPYPHEGVNPQTPDEWMKEAGQESQARASQEEVRQILGSCVSEGSGPCSVEAETSTAELPWSDAEVLLTGDRASKHAAGLFPWMLFALAAVAALGFMLASRSSTGASTAAWQDLDKEPWKPGQQASWLQQASWWQKIGVLLVVLAVGGLFDLTGIMDRFSCGCALLCGLLFNLALSWARCHTASKLGKSCL